MKSLFALLSFGMIFVNVMAEAQLLDEKTIPAEHGSKAVTGKMGEEDEVDTAHEIDANDPSVGTPDKNTPFLLKKSLPQLKVAIGGLSLDLRYNIKKSFYKTLIDFIPAESKALVHNDALYNYFKVHHYRYQPKKEYGPTTVNSNHEYLGISDRKFGYCWGYATMVRYFTELAFFDNKLARKTVTENGQEKLDLKFYTKIVKDVVASKATVIPGFKNFREFSLVPEIEYYLKLNAMELWASRAVRPVSISIFRKANTQYKKEEAFNAVKDLKTRIARGELPKILFSALIASEKVVGINADIHSVLAYKVKEMGDGTTRIYLWDINFYTETLVREPKYLLIDSKGAITYAPWYEPNKPYWQASALVSRFTVAPENDSENIAMLRELHSFCNAEATKHYCSEKRVD